MKKIRVISIIFAVCMMLTVLSGCAGRRWEDTPDDEIVAKIGDKEIAKYLVEYFNVETAASYTLAISSLGGQVDKNKISNMDESFVELAGFAVLAEYAEEQGIEKTIEEAEEDVYQEYVIDAKKSGYEYMSAFMEAVKTTLKINTDEMVAIGAELEQIRASAFNVMEQLYDELSATYEGDELCEQMQIEAEKLIEGIEGEQYIPKKGEIKFDISTAVTQSYYMLKNS